MGFTAIFLDRFRRHATLARGKAYQRSEEKEPFLVGETPNGLAPLQGIRGVLLFVPGAVLRSAPGYSLDALRVNAPPDGSVSVARDDIAFRMRSIVPAAKRHQSQPRASDSAATDADRAAVGHVLTRQIVAGHWIDCRQQADPPELKETDAVIGNRRMIGNAEEAEAELALTIEQNDGCAPSLPADHEESNERE